jgi:hypothetical protein
MSRFAESLWDDLTGDPMPDVEVQSKIDACMALIPQEDDGPWIMEQATGEDAAAAAAHALRCRQNGEVQEAAWAAQRTYEAIFYYVEYRDYPPGSQVHAPPYPHEQSQLARVNADPLVQAELGRQQRDIEDLLAAGDEDVRQIAARFRDRAVAESAIFFGAVS